MSTHIISFYGELSNIIFYVHVSSNIHLICSAENNITGTSPYKSYPDLHLTYSKNGGNLGLILKL